jgi:hypothetical protein
VRYKYSTEPLRSIVPSVPYAEGNRSHVLRTLRYWIFRVTSTSLNLLSCFVRIQKMHYFNEQVISRFIQRRRTLVNFFLLAVMIIFTVIVTNLYVSSERYFYYFDLSNYSNQTSELVASLRESPIKAIWEFYISLSSDYSKLPCLLLIPFISILGDSRWIYICSCAIVYIVPFSLVVGAIAAKLIPIYPRIVFWSTAFLCLLMPATWIAVLRGYPDIGGAFLIGLAVLIYLQDLRLNNRWKALLIGVLLALSILFRRHFAYSARAFLGALILQTFIISMIDGRNQPLKKTVRDLKRYGIWITLTVIISLVTLTVLGPKFVYRLVTVNFRELYSSYEQPISEIFKILWLVDMVDGSDGICCWNSDASACSPIHFFCRNFWLIITGSMGTDLKTTWSALYNSLYDVCCSRYSSIPMDADSFAAR